MSQKVLLVDDCIKSRETTAFALKGRFEQIEIGQAGTLQKAIEIVEGDKSIEWVFCDFDLPDGNGANLYEWMKKEAIQSQFVFVSKLDPDEIPVFKDEKIPYIAKPNIFEALVDLLTRKTEEKERKETDLGENKHYFAIEITQLEKVKAHHCDLYIRLSENKYVKMIKAGAKDFEQKIQDLKKREITVVYIENSEAADIVNDRILEISLDK